MLTGYLMMLNNRLFFQLCNVVMLEERRPYLLAFLTEIFIDEIIGYLKFASK